jgi:hypothetical protein
VHSGKGGWQAHFLWRGGEEGDAWGPGGGGGCQDEGRGRHAQATAVLAAVSLYAGSCQCGIKLPSSSHAGCVSQPQMMPHCHHHTLVTEVTSLRPVACAILQVRGCADPNVSLTTTATASMTRIYPRFMRHGCYCCCCCCFACVIL